MKVSFIGLVAITICFACAQAATNYDLEVKSFLDKASERYYRLYNQIAEKVYNSEQFEDFESAFSTLTTVKKIAKELVQLTNEANQFDRKRINDDNIKRALEHLITAADLFVLDDEYFSSILINISALKSLANDKDIEPYLNGAKQPNGSTDSLSYNPDIIRIFQRSNDSEELLYYWKTWRDKNTLWSSVNFSTIIEALQKAAKLIGITPLEFWYRYYDNKNFLLDMEHVMEELKPSYQQLHAFVRRELYVKYGKDIVDLRGPIPDHLFQQVIDQAWTNESILETYFQFENLLPYDSLIEKYDALHLIKEADKFYQSIGFESLDQHFYQNRLKEYIDIENVGDCRTDVFDGTPQTFMLYCKKVDFRKFMQNHGYLSQLYYAREKKNLPAYFFNSYGLEYPVGEAVILSASTPKYLKKIGLVKNLNITETTLFYRLFRMGLHTILQIPQYFVHAKILNDLLDGRVQMSGINKYYWKLMEDYAGVEPPIHRMEDDIDFPYTFYIDVDKNKPTQKFVSEIVGYQFYRALCQISGETKELHGCDFSGNSAVGNHLKSMMSLGSSKAWREVIANVLPRNETTISANALLEYYKPVFDWVKIRNNMNKDIKGWNASKKKVL